MFFDANKAKLLPYKNVKVWDGFYDVLVLLFSGHGTVPAGQEMFYFVTSDTNGQSPASERDTGLSTAMLAEALRDSGSARHDDHR